MIVTVQSSTVFTSIDTLIQNVIICYGPRNLVCFLIINCNYITLSMISSTAISDFSLLC